MSKPKIVLLFSGGLDSTVLLSTLVGEYDVYALSINYGQKHARELASAMQIAAEYNNGSLIDKGGVWLKQLDLTECAELVNNSALTDPMTDIPEGHYTDKLMKSTVVPNRNMMMISLAASYAINIGAGAVAYAAHAGDHAIYPDCRPGFISKMRAVLRLCSFEPVELIAPFVEHDKTHIVNTGKLFDAPLHLTWSCYNGGDIHCGRCATCVERLEAFWKASVVDPVEYEDRESWSNLISGANTNA